MTISMPEGSLVVFDFFPVQTCRKQLRMKSMVWQLNYVIKSLNLRY